MQKSHILTDASTHTHNSTLHAQLYTIAVDSVAQGYSML